MSTTLGGRAIFEAQSAVWGHRLSAQNWTQCVIKRSQQGADIWMVRLKYAHLLINLCIRAEKAAWGRVTAIVTRHCMVDIHSLTFWFHFSCNIFPEAYGCAKIGSATRCHIHPCVGKMEIGASWSPSLVTSQVLEAFGKHPKPRSEVDILSHQSTILPTAAASFANHTCL